ncbi:hypothetical protein D3C87_1299810 [compost metagenome]
MRDDAVKPFRATFEKHGVPGLELHIGEGGDASRPAQDGAGDDVAIGLFEQFAQRLVRIGAVGGQRRFGGIGRLVENILHRCLLAVAHRQKAITESQEDDADDCQSRADGGEVEHRKALPGHLLAQPRDDDVGRSADLRHQPAQKCRKGHGHQIIGNGAAGFAGKLESDRHHDGERADILDEGRHDGDDDHQEGKLQALGVHFGKIFLDRHIDDAGARHGRTDDQRAADDDDDVIRKTGESLLERHNPHRHRHQQCAAGDDIVT